MFDLDLLTLPLLLPPLLLLLIFGIDRLADDGHDSVPEPDIPDQSSTDEPNVDAGGAS